MEVSYIAKKVAKFSKNNCFNSMGAKLQNIDKKYSPSP